MWRITQVSETIRTEVVYPHSQSALTLRTNPAKKTSSTGAARSRSIDAKVRGCTFGTGKRRSAGRLDPSIDLVAGDGDGAIDTGCRRGIKWLSAAKVWYVDQRGGSVNISGIIRIDTSNIFVVIGLADKSAQDLVMPRSINLRNIFPSEALVAIIRARTHKVGVAVTLSTGREVPEQMWFC